MRKIFFICFLVFIYVVEVNAQTPVIGFISVDTTWTIANSPYYTLGNVLVNEGITLTIEPGVTIEFDTGHKLIIDGTLIAQGTAEDTIRFTPMETMEPGSWGGILFEYPSIGAIYDDDYNYLSGSILQYCVVEFAGPGVKGDSASPFIDYCLISHNDGKGIDISDVDVVVIQNSIIDNNGYQAGIFIEGVQFIKLTGNTVKNNNYRGICIFGENVDIDGNNVSGNLEGIYVESNTVTIRNNILTDNIFEVWASCNFQLLGGGIYVNSTNANIINNTLIGNKVRAMVTSSWYNGDGYGGGIYVESNITTINNNTFTENIADGSGWGKGYGGGVYVEGGSLTITQNTLNNNEADHKGGGVYVVSDDAIIDNNILSENKSGGIYVSVNVSTIKNNTVNNNDGIGIYVDISDTTNIKSNIVIDNMGTGIYINPTACNTINISDNTVNSNKDGGIYGKGTITGNFIIGNICSDENGAGIFYYGSESITCNLIANNVSEGNVNTNTVYITGYPIFNENAIIYNQTDYNLYYDQPNGSPNLDATNNYWGVTTEGEIRALIYDYFQDDQLAIVDVVPFLTENPFGEEPNIWLYSNGHDYGTMPVGEYNDWTLVISNLGNSTLTVINITSDDTAFSIYSPNFPQNISPCDSLNVIVRFSPTEAISYNGTLTIYSNDPDEPEVSVSLSGEGILSDLSLNSDDISFHGITFNDNYLISELLRKGNEVAIASKIHNNGNIEATNIQVRFSDETSNDSIGTVYLVNLEAQDSAYVNIKWVLSSDIEDHIIQVEIVGADQEDYNLENNKAQKNVSVYYTNGTPFDLKVDAYQFGNEELTNFLSPPGPGILGSLFIPEDLLTITGIIASQKEDGYCAGMSYTSILYKQYPQLKPGGEDKNVWDMEMGDSQVTDKIEEYQAQSVIFYPSLFPLLNNPENEYGKIKESLIGQTDKPPALIMRSGIGGLFGKVHAVVAYRIIEVEAEKRVYIYDSNFPINTMCSNPDAASYVTFQNNEFIKPKFEITSVSGFSPINVYEEDYKYVIAITPTLTGPDEEEIEELVSTVSNYFRNILKDDNIAAVMFASPVDAILTDQYGRSIGYTQGTFINEIPEASIEELSDVKIYYLPADLLYSVEATGTDNGTLGLYYMIPNENYVIVVIYDNLPINIDANISINIGQQVTDYTIKIDNDGDGVVDEIKDPDYYFEILTGTPPTGGSLKNDNIYFYPNPFNPDSETGTIRYSLSKPGKVTIKIYDVFSKLIKKIDCGNQETDVEYSKEWDGKNDKGKIVANGVYFYVIKSSSGEKAVGKAAILK